MTEKKINQGSEETVVFVLHFVSASSKGESTQIS